MIRILFIEDDATLMAHMRRNLSIMKRHWDMRFFSSAEDALMSMAERPFDVVVCDLSMPGMNGMELLSLVQYQHPRVVRVLLSESGDEARMVRGVGVAHRILAKPCDPAQLRVAIQSSYDLEQRLSDPDLLSMLSQVGALPSPSASVIELNDLLGHEETSIDDVANVVRSDMGMTAKLLQVVNSAYFSLAHHISDVREAVAYLGLDAVRNLCVAMELLQSLETASPLVQAAVDEIHAHALAVGSLAREITTDRALANESFVAGLLHDVGLLVLATQMPEQFLELRVQTMRTNLPMTEIEMEIIGAHHSDLGAHLLDLWGLPGTIVEAVARHHDAEDIPTEVVDPVHAVFIASALAGCQAENDEDEWSRCNSLDPEYLEQFGLAERAVYLQ